MYCKKCGKLIEDDSQFCKYCGENVGVDTVAVHRRSVIDWFQSKSRTSRLLMIIGLIWLFIGICFLFESEYHLSVFATFIGIPLFTWSIWYYFKYLKKAKNRASKTNILNNQKNATLPEPDQQLDLIPLVDFAKANGHMQVGKYAFGDTGIIKARCLFTKTTYVDFSSELGELSADEISKRKDNLFVKRTEGDKYVLVSKE